MIKLKIKYGNSPTPAAFPAPKVTFFIVRSDTIYFRKEN